MADTPWNTIDPLPAGKNQDIELLVKSDGANYREKAEQLMQAFSGLGTVDGSCSSAIDAEEKTVTLSEYALNVLPREFSVTFTNANTYGNGTTTYPILKVYNSNNQLLGTLPAANSRGRYAGNGAWEAGDILYFRVMAGRACIINSEISTTRDLQARVKDMTLSALDLTEANKTLPVNSSAVDGALANYTKLEDFSPIKKVNNANLAVPSDVNNKLYDTVFYIDYLGTNIPSQAANYRIEFKSRYISVGYSNAVQIAYAINSSNPNIYVRYCSINLSTKIWTFENWKKLTTELDLIGYQENLKAIKVPLASSSSTVTITISNNTGLMIVSSRAVKFVQISYNTSTSKFEIMSQSFIVGTYGIDVTADSESDKKYNITISANSGAVIYPSN